MLLHSAGSRMQLSYSEAVVLLCDCVANARVLNMTPIGIHYGHEPWSL